MRATVWSSRLATPRTRFGVIQLGLAPQFGICPTTFVGLGSISATAFPCDGHARRRTPCPNANTGIATAPQHADQRRARVNTPPLALELDIQGLQRPELARQTLDHELVEPLRLLDVLQPPLAQVTDRHPGRQILLRQLPSSSREQHLTAVAGRADPRRRCTPIPT